jgi:hypothetical protein
MHQPRLPSYGQGFSAFLWGLGLGIYVWLFLWAVGTSKGASFLFGLVIGVLIFFVVRIYGDNPFRNRSSRGS